MEKAFIFDMDGTLLNSMIYWYESGARIIKDYFNDPKVVDKIKEMSAREVVIYAKSELNAIEQIRQEHDDFRTSSKATHKRFDKENEDRSTWVFGKGIFNTQPK